MSSKALYFTSGVVVGAAGLWLYQKYGGFSGVCATAVREFKRLDTDGDGRVSLEEFKEGMRVALGSQYVAWEPSLQRIHAVLVESYLSMDLDGDGQVSASELMHALRASLGKAWNSASKLAAPYMVSVRTIIDAGVRDFYAMDTNKDGVVDLQEFTAGMKKRIGSDQWSAAYERKVTQLHGIISDVVREADANGDGYVSLSEFYNYVHTKAAARFQALL